MANFLNRFREPSTWAALAACAALFTGHDPTATVNTTMQVAGGLASLAGVFLSENNNTPPKNP
ncbi:MAG: hypothetical protein HQM04_16415 [Magnetococcales bacterium]|nr:hypothetical protein [Magnetococcales bacterium]MBF0400701.1 hypothetical protein [Magnetococcales bacterium]